MHAGITYRVVIAGAELRMLVLAREPGGTIGVDLDSGAFVRALHGEPGAGSEPPPASFDVVSAEIADVLEPPDAACPEAVALAGAPRRVGRLSPRRAEKYLAPLRHPANVPLLGFVTPTVPYWTLTGDRPSLGLVEPRRSPVLHWGPATLECRFDWQGTLHSLPVTDPDLGRRALAALGGRSSERATAKIAGFRPRRLLVTLSAPVDGVCHKTVAALLRAR